MENSPQINANIFTIAPILRGLNGEAAQKIGLIVYSIGAMQHAYGFREKDILMF